ncbi:MAG: hypothetical protein LBM77_05470 [Spirochaetaceae bacterium]|jgi:hypothetical protein|nr:hypothetical protein [Spirochaetaceae bacterium]
MKRHTLRFIIALVAFVTIEPQLVSAEIRQMYLKDYIIAQQASLDSLPYSVPSEEETIKEEVLVNQNIMENNDILAFYGHPSSTNMGILGRYSKESLNQQLTELAGEYDAANGDRGVIKAFYLIFGTVWPEGEIGYINKKTLTSYIEFCQENDIIVFIDHQIGKYDPIDSLKTMLPYLRYPNVHLALDPEWRTAKPMKEIGSVTGEEINEAQKVISDYLAEHRLPGERLLVIHQFDAKMIKDRKAVETDYPGVCLVHCADGFGPPRLKRDTYAYLAQAKNMPVKGFKLFYNFNIPGAGYDNPILSPEEVLALDPKPNLIIYQ